METSMSLERLFYAKSIAIVGASQDLHSISGQTIQIALDYKYQGRVYPVNPKYREIAGFPCYPFISDVEGEIDIALLAVAAKRVAPILKECVDKKVKFVDIFSSGFSEMGNTAGQQELLDIIKGSNTRILGPNNQGVFNFVAGIPACFNPLLLVREERIPVGPIGVVAQSSGAGFALIGMGAKRGLGFSYIATVGNQADLGITELARYMVEDSLTSIVACVVESLKPDTDLPAVAKLAKEKGKPFVILKLGRTALGQKASASHSGSLAADAGVFESFCQQVGIILVKDIEEFVDVLVALQGRKVCGKRVAILTETGGSGVLATDICNDFGLALPPLSADTVERMRKILPDYASVQNPVDVTAQVGIHDPDGFATCLKDIGRDPGIDVVYCACGPIFGQAANKYGDDIIAASKQIDKPVFVSWLAPEQPVFSRMREAKISLFPSPYRCVQVLSHLVWAAQPSSETMAPATAVASSHDTVVTSLTEYEAKQRLKNFGISIPRGGLAKTVDEARQLAEQTGYPLVMKLMSPQIPHKTDAGQVLLNINNEAGLEQGYQELFKRAAAYDAKAAIQGVLVEQMLPEPVAELIVGIKNDIIFGPVLLVGLGGIFVEIIKDVARWVLPLDTEAEALTIIHSLKAFPLLNGYRGKPRGDIKALANVLLAVGRFAVENRDTIRELDINPVFLLPEGQGCVCADAVIIQQ